MSKSTDALPPAINTCIRLDQISETQALGARSAARTAHARSGDSFESPSQRQGRVDDRIRVPHELKKGDRIPRGRRSGLEAIVEVQRTIDDILAKVK